MAMSTFNGLPVEFLGNEPANWNDTVWGKPEQQRNQAIYNYLKATRKKRNKTYGAGGVKLPSIGGLRVRRGAKTRLGVRDVITDSNGLIYGYANPAANLKIGMTGPASNRYLSLTRNGAAPRPGGAAGAPASAGVTNPKPPVNDPNAPDNFTGYGDYPMIATYLRGLQQQQTDWNNNWQKGILPAVTSGLTNIANIGAGVAQQYGGTVGTNGSPGGAVSNAYNVAAGIAPAQVAGGLGGASQTYNPNVQAMGQASSSAAGVGARASGTYNTLAAAAAPVSATQGILANLTRQAQTISQSYADKRLTERLRLDQWIQEQKIAQQTAQSKADYSAGVLKLSGAKLDETIRSNQASESIAQQNATTSRINANNAGQKTDAQIGTSNSGYVRAPLHAGPKNQAIIDKTKIVSKDGTTWYKPNKPGKNDGASEQAKSIGNARKTVIEAYYGGKYDPITAVLTPGVGGINRLGDIKQQGVRIASLIKSLISSGELPKGWATKQNIKDFVNGALASGHTYGDSQKVMNTKQYQTLMNWVIRSLGAS